MQLRGILCLLCAGLNELGLPNYNATLALDTILSFDMGNAGHALVDMGLALWCWNAGLTLVNAGLAFLRRNTGAAQLIRCLALQRRNVSLVLGTSLRHSAILLLDIGLRHNTSSELRRVLRHERWVPTAVGHVAAIVKSKHGPSKALVFCLSCGPSEARVHFMKLGSS